MRKPSLLITALGLGLILIAGQALAAPQWREGRHYSVGEVVYYQGQPFRVLQSHTAWRGARWTPQAAPSLWEPVRYARNDGRHRWDDDDDDDDEDDDDDRRRWRRHAHDDKPWARDPHWRPGNWERGHRYRKGEWVWHEGYAYRATRNVDSGIEINWRPREAPDVWVRVTVP
ncbi:hypothetical protein N8I74_17845 [Chitiniphilus purpureus]|uniref:Chitin-binding type-3 domain-containing protein n=1 Tax=Chitiniphilus purpureus TaxID=2981137 RepID=A0ABY6DMC1_9NEIS|nr:carbohydrate-binding protein [Chitiniphilus sp. CD1]UXY15152.1 hypothetical protein N8I74_17845 [Chitiniphilus sp. CD1]